MSWVTFFGDAGVGETDRLRDAVEQWAERFNIEFHYRHMDQRTREEYNVGVVPTVRYFHPANGPREQFEGALAIERLLARKGMWP